MILKNLCVKNGSYTDRDGNEKGRWVTIGQIHEAKDGGTYITLDAHVNLAAFPRKDGDTRVMVSQFDPKGREESPKSRREEPADFDDDKLPF